MFIRLEGGQRGDNVVTITELTDVRLTLVGFPNGGDAILRVDGGEISLSANHGAYRGSIVEWIEAAGNAYPGMALAGREHDRDS